MVMAIKFQIDQSQILKLMKMSQFLDQKKMNVISLANHLFPKIYGENTHESNFKSNIKIIQGVSAFRYECTIIKSDNTEIFSTKNKHEMT